MLARTVMERPTGRGLVARGKEVIIVGAGDAAQLIVKEMLKNPSLGYTPIGLVDDVLGREPVDVDLHAVASYLADATVLVTGAGGSIGAELCRQIARIGCKRLILVDQGETPLFEIERELVSERAFSPCVPVLADVGNRGKMRQIFDRYSPSVVFHAAAYKHVPLMEANPLESVRNNTLATKAVVDVAAEVGVDRFLLVSTDKAG